MARREGEWRGNVCCKEGLTTALVSGERAAPFGCRGHCSRLLRAQSGAQCEAEYLRRLELMS
ncbi:Protein of unknown function [Gryllus bimaculatus]|nr:Protein of unknown function [Gryllus bimaculatus]